MKTALVFLNQKWEDKEYNLQRCRDFVHKAKENGAELIIFPEMTLTGFSMDTDRTAENPENSETIAEFVQIAKKYSINIVFGVVLRGDNGKATNNLVMVDAHGNIQVNYAKIHPFTYAGEDKYFEGGDSLNYAQLNYFNIGFAICYDLRFPEIFAAMSRTCDMIIVIANWPAKRVEHWETLLKGRAIETQCYMAGVNRTGIDGNGLEYIKSSHIIDPNGIVLLPVYSEPELDIYDLEKKLLDDFRAGFPVVRDKRDEIYKSFR